MRSFIACIFTLLLIGISQKVYSQYSDSLTTSKVSTAYTEKVSARIHTLEQKLGKASAKKLARFARHEEKLRKKLARIDSNAANRIFSDAKDKYDNLQRNLQAGKKSRQYIPYLDTLKSSLKFLEQNKDLLSNRKDDIKKLEYSLSKIGNLENQLQNAEDIKRFMKERKEFLKAQLSQFGLAKHLKKINKEAYYYSQQIKEYKEIINSPDKIERKTIELLSKTKVFKDFISRNGKLAEMFGIAGAVDPSYLQASLGRLQTRTQVNQLIQNQIAAGGPNAQQVIQSNIRQGQSLLNDWKNQLNKFGNNGSEDILPEGFTPNPEKTKPFLKRFELFANLQSERAHAIFPATTDFGLGVGYRLSSTGIVGIGASYKMGWGQSIDKIHITSQGMSLRSYVDWKLTTRTRKNFISTLWISGGYEQNYKTEIKSIDQLRDFSAWQASGLIGMSKKIPVQSKFLKGTRVQLLWDFLSYSQVPRSNPVVFRLGYNFK